MVKRLSILWLMTGAWMSIYAQHDSISHKAYQRRIIITSAANAVFWTGSYVALNRAWYKGYARTPFHFFNDNAEWNQMDKAGHAWTAYTLSRASARMWKWTGLHDNASAILGGSTGLVYQSMIELQDAHSAQWGFSWGDMAANTFGAVLFTGQQLIWNDQRIQLKLGYTPRTYSPDLLSRRNDLFGTSAAERILKDYNGQTYWLGVNIHSMFPDSGIPRWLNIAFGYSADGLLGARTNIWTDPEGKTYDFRQVPRVRHFWLSPDLDLTKFSTKSKLLHTALFLLNSIKIPAPALEYNTQGKLKLHALRF